VLSNAIKYSPNESDIYIDILDVGDEWKVTVTDFGEGISDEDKSKLFTRFKRVDKKGIKGTGLGLEIVKRIIDLHSGNVGIEDNTQGQGTIFLGDSKKGITRRTVPKISINSLILSSDKEYFDLAIRIDTSRP
jgi:signal transduction histidine kinase